MHFIGFLLCANKQERKSALKRLRYYVSQDPRQCILQVSGNTLQQLETFKYLGVVFTSDRSRNKGIDTWIDKTNAVLRDLYCSVVTKRELSKTAKHTVFKAIFVPILTCGHESYSR